MQVWVQSLFLFALVWSIGANTDEEGRATFDHMLRKLLINDAPADLRPYVKVSPVHIHIVYWLHHLDVTFANLNVQPYLVYSIVCEQQSGRFCLSLLADAV